MNNKNLVFVLLAFIILGFSSCLSDDCTEQKSFYQYKPVYFTKSDFRVDVTTQAQTNLENPGKMYYYKDLLFINEQGKGVHIYNNEDPANPIYVTFYKIIGNFDIVIKNDIMIADNVIDLIAIDISEINNPKTVNRVENYKEEYEYDPGNGTEQLFYAYSIKNPVNQILDCSDDNFFNNSFSRNDVFFTTQELGDLTKSTTGSASAGIGGSTARFTLVGDYLYMVNQYSLLTYDISSVNDPQYRSTSNLGWGIETIFPYENNLFIGSNSGMFIYSIENPENPSQVSTFQHARACDPVVVSGDYAYVTLRDGSLCEGFNNQLELIDISDLLNPKLIDIYPMKNPHGLSVAGNELYLSEGDYGLKVLDVSNKDNLKEIAFDQDVKSTDVIYLGDGHLLSVGSDGFHQLDVSDPLNIKELSFISVDRK